MLGALVGFVVGQFRSRASLVAENELLRQQLAAAKSRLRRKRVMFRGSQRLTIALLTRWTVSWRATVTLVQPATVLRWHREGFRLLWRWRSRIRGRKPTSYATLIRAMAERNPRWGAERLRGELLKLGIRVSKRTVQRYMKKRVPGDGQRWTTFLRNLVRSRRNRTKIGRKSTSKVCTKSQAEVTPGGDPRRGGHGRPRHRHRQPLQARPASCCAPTAHTSQGARFARLFEAVGTKVVLTAVRTPN